MFTFASMLNKNTYTFISVRVVDFTFEFEMSRQVEKRSRVRDTIQNWL